MKFRKKPVVIEAIKFEGLDKNKFQCCEFMKGNPFEVVFNEKHNTMDIVTLEGAMTVSPNDWIIKGVKGEFYPCKPDIFEMTYEPEAIKGDG